MLPSAGVAFHRACASAWAYSFPSVLAESNRTLKASNFDIASIQCEHSACISLNQ